MSVLAHGIYLQQEYEKAQGVLEVCLRKNEPEVYKKLVDGIIAFSRGWTNQEIAQHMGLSVNTVKHYVSDILDKLQIDKREKIKEFVNQ